MREWGTVIDIWAQEGVTASGFRAAVSALRSLDGGGCEFSHLHAPGGPLGAASGEEPGQGYA